MGLKSFKRRKKVGAYREIIIKNGKLSSFSVEIGETKTPGEHLGQIDRLDGFKLQANIDERYISRVFIGQEAEFDFDGKNYRLYIDKIYTDVTAGSFQVDLY